MAKIRDCCYEDVTKNAILESDV